MIFDKINHTYTRKGVEYKSVSAFISDFEKSFPKEMIADMTAKRDGRDYDDIIDEWDTARDLSTEFGNAIDKSIEYFVKWGKKPKQLFLKKVVDEFEELTKGMKLTAQTILYSDKNQVAGTTDLIQSHGDKEITIFDVKSNGDIYQKAKNNFLEPFKDIPCSKINKYSFQQTLYKAMAEEHKYKVRDIYLLHYTDKWTKIKLTQTDLKKIWKK